MTVEEKICIRSLEQLAVYLSSADRRGGERAPNSVFYDVAATWAIGDPPIDVRLLVDDARLVHRIQNNCGSPETSVLVAIGGRNKLVDITLRPVPNPRPARKGKVTIIDLPPAEADEDPAEEE